MNSIGKKIQIALIGSISVVAVCAVALLLINQLSALQNRQIIQTMTMEYSIIKYSDTLIKSYNDVVKNQGSKDQVTEYQSVHGKLTTVLATLKKRIISEDSKVLFIGVENTVNQVIDECDNGIKEVQNNNFLNFSEHFDKANKENTFVQDNTSSLLQKELEYLSNTEIKSEQVAGITLFASLCIFVLVVFIMIFYARSFAQQLITPLVKLSIFAEEIASGNLKNRDREQLQMTNDETGSLTKSIYTMVDKLTETIDREQQTSDELKKTSTTIANNNIELQRMNALMVGRELKMSEMKEQVEELQKELDALKKSNA